MEERTLTADIICQFKEHLILEERSENTIEKYMRDIKAFVTFLSNATLSKEVVIEYKKTIAGKLCGSKRQFYACKYKQSVCFSWLD